MRLRMVDRRALAWFASGVLVLVLGTACTEGSVSEIVPQQQAIEAAEEQADNACYASYEAVQQSDDAVPCTEDHLAEIVSIYETDGDDYPGEVTLTQDAQQRCPDAFRVETGVSIDTTLVALGIVYPTSDAWEAGNRTTVCVIAFPKSVNEPLSRIDPQRAYGMATFYGLEQGDCLDELTGDFIEIAPCARPHAVEVFEIFELEPGSFPGEIVVNNLAINHCFERYDALYRNDASVEEAPFDFVAPTERTWTAFDDRAIICLAYISGA